ncbi:MAG: hypothetical protein ACKVRN_10515 [Pyrinomonadaceae bacterium]
MQKILKLLVLFVFILIVLAAGCFAQDDGENATVVNDKPAARKLLGKHRLSLQWVSWDYFGTATVTNEKCFSQKSSKKKTERCYRLRGKQSGRGNTDFVTVNGLILAIDAKEFLFRGEIKTQVSHINNGKPCVRSGDFTFRITGNRRYWRLKEMDNPCDPVADYVDIYFR